MHPANEIALLDGVVDLLRLLALLPPQLFPAQLQVQLLVEGRATHAPCQLVHRRAVGLGSSRSWDLKEFVQRCLWVLEHCL